MKLLIVDDHPIVRAGLRRLLAALPECVVSEVASGREVLTAFREQRPDMIMLDLNLPDFGGLEVLRRVLLEDAAARVLIFSQHTAPLYATQALQAGARGYVSKSAPPEEIIEAVRRVSEGKRYIERDIAQEMALRNVPGGDQPDQSAALSAREVEILRLLAQGRNLTEIAAAIGISYKTVANTLSLIKNKLGVQRTADLVRIAVETGIS